MICLQCGDCCIRFAIPELNKREGERCGYLSSNNKCTIYKNRPQACKDHDYPFRVCPIGQEKNQNKPTGKCMNCGSMLFNNRDFCDEECYSAFRNSCYNNGG